jgi:hypothetical protein
MTWASTILPLWGKKPLENRKKLKSIRIMNSVNFNSVGIFNDNVFIDNIAENSIGRTTFPTNTLGMDSYSCTYCREYKSHPNFQVQPECMNKKEYSQFYSKDPQNIIDILQCHGTDPHGSKTLCMQDNIRKMLRSTLYYEAFTMRPMNLGKQLNAKALHGES